MTNTTTAAIKDIVSVRQSHIRSVNVVYDIQKPALLDQYLLTPQVILSTGRVLSGIQNGGTRAWTLTGPYGSGKSFFSLFIATLLSGPSPEQNATLSKIRAIDPALTEQIETVINDRAPYMVIPITGYRASLETCFREGILKSLEAKSIQPSVKLYQSLTDPHQRFIHVIEMLSDELTKSYDFTGIVFIFDEMGKALEQASVPGRENDVYLLQEIAESTSRGSNLFLGILHQSFERYATLLDNATQREWAKVQGRFEDMPFQEPPIQQMRLFQRAIQRDAGSSIDALALDTATRLANDGWNPAQMDRNEFIELSAAVYPFHPSTLAILPYFFRKLAQNERSIFAFLTSQEPFGFQNFVENNPIGKYFNLPDLFDYLITNFQFHIFSSGRAKTLSEAAERLETQTDLTPTEIAIVKTISLLNWLSEITHLTATKTLLFSALSNFGKSSADLTSALKNLEERSIIIYRRVSHSYVIWQGSDVDINEHIDQAINKLTGSLALASSLQRYMPGRPLVARKHSYETGTTRYFETRYLDIHNYEHASLTPATDPAAAYWFAYPKNFLKLKPSNSGRKKPQHPTTRVSSLSSSKNQSALLSLFWNSTRSTM